jgi:predicted ATPase
LPGTPALRREEVKLQVALITPLLHTKGYTAPETNAATERANLLIRQAEALGEPLEDPMLLFSILYSLCAAHAVTFNGDMMRERAGQILALAKKQSATAPLVMGHRLMGFCLLNTGEIAEGRAHLDRAIALYDPTAHRPLAIRFGQDMRVASLCWRSLALWMLGYPDAALADADHAIKDAREIGQAPTLLWALTVPAFSYFHCGNYATANLQSNEVIALAGEKGALFWSAWATCLQGCLLTQPSKASDRINMITSGITAFRSTGSTFWMSLFLSYLAMAHAEFEQFDDAWRCIDDAITAVEAGNERGWEAEVHRIAGEIALKSVEPEVSKAQAYFERALAVARQQQAKSWELRAAMSMARLWRSQGKQQQARELLAPVYGWFTEGFDTRDLKEAKALLAELA